MTGVAVYICHRHLGHLRFGRGSVSRSRSLSSSRCMGGGDVVALVVHGLILPSKFLLVTTFEDAETKTHLRNGFRSRPVYPYYTRHMIHPEYT